MEMTHRRRACCATSLWSSQPRAPDVPVNDFLLRMPRLLRPVLGGINVSNINHDSSNWVLENKFSQSKGFVVLSPRSEAVFVKTQNRCFTASYSLTRQVPEHVAVLCGERSTGNEYGRKKQLTRSEDQGHQFSSRCDSQT